MKTHWILKGIGIAILVGLGIFLLGYAVMGLWNWLMPILFPGAAILTYWQAMGLLALCKILFGGGFKGRHGCHGGHCGHRGGYWRSRWKEKWEGMSEEEREKLRSRCGDWYSSETKKSE